MGNVSGRRAPVLAIALAAAVAGSAILARGAAAQHDSDEMAAVLAAEGQLVFGTSCVSCHDADGGDGAAPALNGHPSLGATDHIVRQILRGNAEKGMPAFAANLSDRQVAAVATYIRTAWDNAHGVVVEADVKRVRAEPKPD
jgi:mono/diheme cytochrome c family protein